MQLMMLSMPRFMAMVVMFVAVPWMLETLLGQ